MSILNKLFGKKEIDKRLNGIWIIDHSDSASIEKFGDVSISFNDGNMTYDITEAEKIQRIIMTYYTHKGLIITNQHSEPREEKSKYHFENMDTLIIEFDGIASTFKRVRENGESNS